MLIADDRALLRGPETSGGDGAVIRVLMPGNRALLREPETSGGSEL
ncbi:hypothetical protein ACPPVO_59305 [Dactylosporangium sp. McL0621]